MFKFSLNSIKTRVRLFFIINIALVAVNYLLTDVANDAAQNDRQLVQVSRENEKFIEKLDLITKSIVENGEKDLKTTLDKESNKYSANLEALRNGGDATIGEALVPIPTYATKKLSELKTLDDSWKQLRRHLQIIIDKQIEIDTTIVIEEGQADDGSEEPVVITPDTTKKIDEKKKPEKDVKEPKKEEKKEEPLQTQAQAQSFTKTNPEVEQHYYLSKTVRDEVLNKNRELSEVYEASFRNSQTYLRFVLLITFLLNLGVLVGGTFVIGTYFINPLKNIATTAKQVAEGDVSTRVIYPRKDEIGEVSDSLNQIVDSFKKYTEFAQQIGKGKFDTDFKTQGENDTLGDALLGMRNSLKEVSEEDSKRNWANEGFTLFSNLLRITDKNMEEFCYSIISNLVKYLDANQGGFFLLVKNPKGDYLDLQASFAYNRRKYEQKQVTVGQGLLGQSVMEKSMIYIDEVPRDYVQITSGLGKASPRCLLIVPLQVNEEVFGAIEMASFRYFEKHELVFIERMAENIASTLATLRNSENTRQLLEETQTYAKQMQEQEEKMRLSMDELAQTKEEMERNQRKLDDYRKNLEREIENRTLEIREKEIRLAQVNTQLQGIIDSTRAGIVAVDTRYQVVAANHLSREQIRKRYQMEFKMGDNWLNIFANEQERLKNKLRWDKALGGNFFTEEEKYVTEKGKVEWYEISFNPMIDDSKNVIGASMIVRDITERKRELLNIEISAHALDNSTSEVYLFNAQTLLFTQANERACENLGYSQEEIKTVTPYQIMAGYDQAQFREILVPLEKGEKKDLEFETVLQRKNGSSYDGLVDLQLFDDPEMPVYVAIVHDITQRKRNDLELKEALARFDLATQATKEGIWELHVSPTDPLNPDNTAWWSDRFKELIGLKENDPFPEKLVSWSARIHPDDRAHTLRALYEHLTDRTGEVDFQVEYRLLTTQNEYEWFSASGETQRDTQGNPLKMVGSIRNITRRKKAEGEVLEKTTIVNAILNATVNSISAIDSNFNVLVSNPATMRIFGYTPEEMVGKSILSLLENPNEDLRNYVNKTQTIKGRNKAGDSIDLEITVTSGVVGEKTIYVVVFRVK
jgi:PAS domain S-box-containing protein